LYFPLSICLLSVDKLMLSVADASESVNHLLERM